MIFLAELAFKSDRLLALIFSKLHRRYPLTVGLTGHTQMRRMERQLEFQQILESLKEASFGDLAFLDHGRPAVVPLSFGFQLEEGSGQHFSFTVPRKGARLRRCGRIPPPRLRS